MVSEDPYFAAMQRIWTEKVNRECCSPYYGVLVRKDPAERKEHFDKLIHGLKVSCKDPIPSGTKRAVL